MVKKAVLVIIVAIALATAGAVLAGEPVAVFVNGKEIQTDVPSQIINNRVMVPARFVSEALGAKVEWDGPNNRVIISTDQNYTIKTDGNETLKLIKVNGEQTTWPYWHENGALYMEYHNAIELIRLYNRRIDAHFFKSSNKLNVNDGIFEVPTLTKGPFTTISITFLKEQKRIINYEWDTQSGNMKFLPI